MPGFGEVDNFDHMNSVSAEIDANPGVFASPAEREAFKLVVADAISNAEDAQKKLAIAGKAIEVIKGGLTGGISGAIASILGALT